MRLLGIFEFQRKHKMLRLRSLHPKNQHPILGDHGSPALVKTRGNRPLFIMKSCLVREGTLAMKRSRYLASCKAVCTLTCGGSRRSGCWSSIFLDMRLAGLALVSHVSSRARLSRAHCRFFRKTSHVM